MYSYISMGYESYITTEAQSRNPEVYWQGWKEEIKNTQTPKELNQKKPSYMCFLSWTQTR